MKTIVKGLNKLLLYGYYLFRNIGALCLFGIFFAITAGIISRYVFNSPFTWTEELTCFMMVHICFLSACITTATDNHIVADFLVTKFPDKAQKIIKQFGRICQIFFCAVLFISGIKILPQLTWTSPALAIPRQYYYVTAIFGSVYMIICVITLILNDFYPGYNYLEQRRSKAAAAAAAEEAAEAAEMMEDMDAFLDEAGIAHDLDKEEKEGNEHVD